MAITFVRTVAQATSTGSMSIAFGASVAVGDLLVVMLDSTATTDSVPVISDNVNAGAWNLPASLHFFASTQGVQIMAWIRCDTAGTPTISISNLSANFYEGIVGQYTGFPAGNPVLVPADITSNSGNSTSPAATPLTNSIAPELTLCYGLCFGGQSFGTITGSFTQRTSVTGSWYGDVVNTTSGNVLNFGATIASNKWRMMLASFQGFSPPLLGQILM
jgi:hypothetical protein